MSQLPKEPRLYLPRSDGTRDVFCENGYRKRMPCTKYLTVDADNNIISGIAALLPHGSLRFCSWKCVASYINRTQNGIN